MADTRYPELVTCEVCNTINAGPGRQQECTPNNCRGCGAPLPVNIEYNNMIDTINNMVRKLLSELDFGNEATRNG